MSKREDSILIEDILVSIDKIEEYIKDCASFAEFERDHKTVDAVIRNLEIIGEASSHLSDGFKDKNAHIEWVKIIGLRNRVIHGYFCVDLNIVWAVLNSDLKKFKSEFKKIGFLTAPHAQP